MPRALGFALETFISIQLDLINDPSVGRLSCTPMKTKIGLLLLLGCLISNLRAAPQPYAWEIVYRSAAPERSASAIRKHPALRREVNIDFLGFLRTIQWEKAKSDPTIRREAGPVTMMVDCYARV